MNFLAESIELRQPEEHHSFRILKKILSCLSNKTEIAEGDKTEIGEKKYHFKEIKPDYFSNLIKKKL